MTAYRFYTADVFPDRAFGANPLAVFPDARALSGAHMQEIARKFLFVPLRDRDALRRVRLRRDELPPDIVKQAPDSLRRLAS